MTKNDNTSSIVSRIDALEKAFAELKTAMSSKPTKEKKERTKRGPSAWSLFIKFVTSDMKKINPEGKFRLPEIAEEAKKRKNTGKYDEAHWKAEAQKLKDATLAATSAEASAAEASAAEVSAAEASAPEVTEVKPKAVRKKAPKKD